jgi:hypothetical protein
MAVADWMAGLTWKCDICHRERPDAMIAVHKVDIGPANLPPWTVVRNVKYCIDNPACREGAVKWKEDAHRR